MVALPPDQNYVNVAFKKHYLAFKNACLRKTSRAGSQKDAPVHVSREKSLDYSVLFPRE